MKWTQPQSSWFPRDQKVCVACYQVVSLILDSRLCQQFLMGFPAMMGFPTIMVPYQWLALQSGQALLKSSGLVNFHFDVQPLQ